MTPCTAAKCCRWAGDSVVCLARNLSSPVPSLQAEWCFRNQLFVSCGWRIRKNPRHRSIFMSLELESSAKF